MHGWLDRQIEREERVNNYHKNENNKYRSPPTGCTYCDTAHRTETAVALSSCFQMSEPVHYGAQDFLASFFLSLQIVNSKRRRASSHGVDDHHFSGTNLNLFKWILAHTRALTSIHDASVTLPIDTTVGPMTHSTPTLHPTSSFHVRTHLFQQHL